MSFGLFLFVWIPGVTVLVLCVCICARALYTFFIYIVCPCSLDQDGLESLVGGSWVLGGVGVGVRWLEGRGKDELGGEK